MDESTRGLTREQIVSVSLVFACLAPFGMATVFQLGHKMGWEEAGYLIAKSSLIDQLNAFAESLDPGTMELVVVPRCDAEELVLTLPYSMYSDLKQALPGWTPKTIEANRDVVAYAEGVCDVVWLKERSPVSTHEVRLPAMRFQPAGARSAYAWKLGDRRMIRVRKPEGSSRDSPVLEFMDDEASRLPSRRIDAGEAP